MQLYPKSWEHQKIRMWNRFIVDLWKKLKFFLDLCPFQPKWTVRAKETDRERGRDSIYNFLISQYVTDYSLWFLLLSETLSKPQRTRGFSSYHKITVHRLQILTKSKVKILTRPSFRILTKIQLRNLNRTSPKYSSNFSFKIAPELQLQNLDQSAQSLNKS